MGSPESEMPEHLYSSTEPLDVPRYKDLIGNTPLIDISSISDNLAPGVKIYGKCEFLNPGFSMKDRIVKNILDKAEKSGKLQMGGTVVAASSGNTGASLALIAATRGYNVVVTTTPKCSEEKMNSIKAYGAKLHVSPSGLSDDHPESYLNMARKLAADNEGWFDIDQYENLDNPEGHFLTLGPEIWRQTKGRVSHFVLGGSTGGTISGVGRFLKGKQKDIKCILADPYGSIFYEYHKTGKHGAPKKFLVEGIGKGYIPGCLNFDVIDDVVQVSDQDSLSTCHILARKEGLMVGGSAGLNVFAAKKSGRISYRTLRRGYHSL
ncbi:putative cystathionine beta-synthase MT1108 [Lepeophtheirus salmonis]|uniref:putative cystathionine beta-synthase MT1108 n=1 Tax=Lepeophtheirus salmonis TaxID=72036 RepID=UPI001AEA42AA|nr:putative cystathionine beta-synthase MT1108 [Lepeophtheirus salmonis]